VAAGGGARTPLWIKVFLVLGVLAVASLPFDLIGAGLSTRKIVEPVPGGLRTTGQIVSVSSESELHGRVYTPTILFTARDGHVYTFDGPSDVRSQKVGTNVTVSYNPANPNRAADLSAGSTSWKALFWSGVALVPIELAVIVLLTIRIRKVRKARPARSGLDPTS
jgi:uncharacterized protein DUF3592